MAKKLRLGLMLLFWLGFGYVLVYFVFQLVQGPERSVDLGHGYWINNWPGTLIHWNSSEYGDYECPFSGKIIAFEVRDPWLIGRTEAAWFAINTVNNSTHYPLESEVSVEAITGLSVTASDLVTNPFNPWFPSRFEVISPWAKIYVALAVILYLGISFFAWGVGQVKKNGKTLTATHQGASDIEMQ